MKIHPVGAELFYADGQTHRRITKLIACRFFAFLRTRLKIIETGEEAVMDESPRLVRES